MAQSLGQMVSRAALAQFEKPIEELVKSAVNQLGQKLAIKQTENTALMFTRIVAIEKMLIEKNIVTQEDLQNKVADVEDERDGATKADDLQSGDTARISVRTKDVSAENYETGSTKLKVLNVGSGNTMGTEVETAILGMKVGELKVVTFASNKLNAEITLSRVSRPIPPPPEPTVTQPQEGKNANPDKVQG